MATLPDPPEQDAQDPRDPDTASHRGAAEEAIPLAPSGRPYINRPSLTDESSHADLDRCPNCNTPMPDPDAVVCLNCGWDLVANRPATDKAARAQRERAGAALRDDDDEHLDSYADRAALSRPDKIGWQIPLAIGAAAIVAAATLAGVQAPPGEWLRPVIRVLLYGPIQIGLGFVAVAITARLLEQRLGDAALAASRMALAVGLFFLLYHVGRQFAGLHPILQWILGAGVGAVVYFLLVWLLFSLSRDGALMVAGTHFALWLVFWLLLITIEWLERAPTPTPS